MGRLRKSQEGIKSLGTRNKQCWEGIGCVWEPRGQNNERRHSMGALNGKPGYGHKRADGAVKNAIEQRRVKNRKEQSPGEGAKFYL